MKPYQMLLVAGMLLSISSIESTNTETYYITNKRKDKKTIKIVGTGDHQCIDCPPKGSTVILPYEAKVAQCDLHVETYGSGCWETAYQKFDIYIEDEPDSGNFIHHGDNFKLGYEAFEVPSWLHISTSCHDCDLPLDFCATSDPTCH